MTAIARPSVRPLGLACMFGGAGTVVASAVTGVVTGSTDVSEDLYRYPWSESGYVAFALVAAVLHALVFAGLLGFRRSGAAGDTRWANAGSILALAGTAGLFVAELLTLSVANGSDDADAAGAVDAVFGLATVPLIIGTIALAVTTLRAGVWRDWRRFAPVACAASVVLIGPIQMTSILWAGVGLYGLCFLALGLALVAEGPVEMRARHAQFEG
jgi:hypothetical protein